MAPWARTIRTRELAATAGNNISAAEPSPFILTGTRSNLLRQVAHRIQVDKAEGADLPSCLSPFFHALPQVASPFAAGGAVKGAACA